MRLAARFPGTCPTCSLPIAMGDHVEWTKGAKATHTSCPTASAPASKPAAPVAKRAFQPTRCTKCGTGLDAYQQRRGFRTCLDCAPGGGNYMGGQSYTTRDGRFVLGDDD